MAKNPQGVRYAEVDRETRTTRIQVVLDLDGGVRCDVSTGLRFLDSMLELMVTAAGINLGIRVDSNESLDDFHLIEDIGAAVGRAIREALRDAEPIVRFADCATPCDEALVLVAMDVSGRGLCAFQVTFERDRIGDTTAQHISRFFRGVCVNAGIAAHIRAEAGTIDHALCEAAFVGFGRALQAATRVAERSNGSANKGSLD